MQTLFQFIFLFSLCTLGACKQESKDGVLSGGGGIFDGSSSNIEPYIEEFMDRLTSAGLSPDISGLSVLFTNDLPSNILGTCVSATKSVRINRTLWLSLNSGHREELIFHELGHCVLGRGHDSTILPGGLPKSIMNPYHLGPTIYTDSSRYANYQTELFAVNASIFSGLLFDPTMYAVSSISADEAISQHLMLPLDERVFICPDGEIH